MVYALFIALILAAPLAFDEFWLNRFARYLVFGMLGMAIALSWGYAGILNLGQGLFFGAGAYMLAMSLKLASYTSLQQGSDRPVPDFMLWNAEPGAPTELCCIVRGSWLWLPFQNQWFGVLMGILLPVAIATAFGMIVFRKRISGVFVAIITLALVLLVRLLVIDAQPLTNGFNSLTDLGWLTVAGFEFDAYNRWGLERTVQFSGGSCIIEPDGNVASMIDTGDGIAYATIDIGRARQREVLSEPVFEGRRPELYMNLMTNSFTWNPNDFFRLYGYRPLPPGRLSRAAVAQFAPGADAAKNLARIEVLAKEAIDKEKPDLIVFPELSLTGLDDPSARAQEVNGEAVSGLVRLAMKLRIYLVAGLAERDGDTFHNTAVLAGPEGLVGAYRKIHLGAADRKWATAGADWKVFDLVIGRVGLLIGHDALYPEAVRSLALLGCDLVACPAAIAGRFTGAHPGTKIPHNYPIPTAADPYHWHAFRVRGGESNVYFAFANVLDPARGLPGKSGVFGPDTFVFPRQESAILEEEGFAAAAVDTTNLDTPYPTNIVRRKDLVVMRLPHHYHDLVKWHQ